jgi:hypothetical protein
MWVMEPERKDEMDDAKEAPSKDHLWIGLHVLLLLFGHCDTFRVSSASVDLCNPSLVAVPQASVTDKCR